MGWKSLLAALLLAGIARADTAVPRSGPILKGAIIVDQKLGKLTFHDETQPLRGFLLVEKDDGRLVWSPGVPERMEAYRRIVYEARRPKLVDLAKRAVRARDHVTARRLYDWAVKEGLDGRDERIIRKRVENLEKKPRKIDEKRRAEVIREERQLQSGLPDLLLARAKLNKDGRLELLRAILRDMPDNGAALEMVRAEIPQDSPFQEPKEWLAWHLDLESRGFALADPELMELKRAQHFWRPDLYGVTSEHMLLITPLRDIDIVAACALRMRITIDTLAHLFKTDKPLLRSKKPLTVYLFINRKNFAEKVGYEGAVSVPPYYHWALGTFDSRENLTRLLCHDKIQSPDNRQLAYTLVHEVARHWMHTYCPRFSDRALFNAGDASGYCLSVGFLNFLAEAEFDLDKGRVDFASRKSASLEYVKDAAGGSGPLFDWSKFFLVTADDIHVLNGQDEELYKVKRKRPPLGHVFMFQGGATCHYLFNAERSRYRDALIEFITNQYLGKQEKLNPRKVFGKSPEELGEAVIAWAKQ